MQFSSSIPVFPIAPFFGAAKSAKSAKSPKRLDKVRQSFLTPSAKSAKCDRSVTFSIEGSSGRSASDRWGPGPDRGLDLQLQINREELPSILY